MKNDIDDILNSMFRGGTLQTRRKKDQMEDLGEALSQAADRQEQAGKALEEAAQAGDRLSRSLEESLRQLTREAQADMAGLERQLREDGVDHRAAAGNQGPPQDLDAAFETARMETQAQVLGQEEFVEELTLAFKRPFVAGSKEGAPLCRGAVLGPHGTGRHSALETLTASLGRQGVLKSGKLSFLRLSAYGAAGSEKVFVQDLYAALKSGAVGLVFEEYSQCHPGVLALVSQLFQTGSLPLPGRYAEQKGMLVDIGTALVPGVVSSLSGAGKYLFLLGEDSPGKLSGVFGGPFLAALDQVCETKPFTEEDLLELARRRLGALGERCAARLGLTLSWGEKEAQALASAYHPDLGAEALAGEEEKLYKALSELKLRGELTCSKGTLCKGEQGWTLTPVPAEQGKALSLEPQEPVGDQTLAEVKEELSQIVGLQTVKDYILSLEDNFKVQQMRKEQGLKADSPSMHMIFTGNPGTGKTTMARIVSRYLKAIGVLRGGQLVEVTRADLVGQYVGHTAPLTQKAMQAALGGVLFIDEAYALCRGKDDSFGLEAIDTLVKGMEDHRDELIVILAGYSREMEEFLNANSGLRSRFPNVIEFPDYTAQELLDITKSIVKGKGYRLDPGCDRPLLRYYEEQQRTGDPRVGGNGRMARNKVEEAVIACSRRNVNLPEEQQDLELLLPEDFGV